MAAVPATNTPFVRSFWLDNNGNKLNGGLLFTYAAGTTTKQNTYTDSSTGTANANPVVLDANGRADVFLDPTLAPYKFVLSPSTDSDPPTNAIWTEDNVWPAFNSGVPLALTTQALNETSLTLSSAATVNIGGAKANYIFISGTVTITAFDTVQSGTERTLEFQGALTLTNNNTSLILPDSLNITTAAGDVAKFRSEGSGNWRCVSYLKKSGASLIDSAANSFKGNNTGSTAATTDLTVTQALALLGNPAVAASFKNLQLVGSGTGVTITADEIVVEDGSGNVVKLSTVNQSIAWATSGAGGLDTGTFNGGGNAFYFHWIIYNSSTVTVKAITSLSSTAPTMPAGFTFKARVGATRSVSATKAWHIQQFNRRAQIIMDGADLTGLPAIGGPGTAGSVSVPTYVSLSTANFVPTTASRIVGVAGTTNGITIAAPNGNYGASTSTTNPPPCVVDSTAAPRTPFDFALETANIFWASSAAGGFIVVLGWEDNI